MLSELATNAVLHAGTDFTVSVDLDDAPCACRCATAAAAAPRAAPVRPRRHHRPRPRPGGSLAQDWGVEVDGAGKTVWCLLPLHPRARRRARPVGLPQRGRPGRAGPVTAGRVVEVRLLELPTSVHERAQAHGAGLTREFRLLREQVRDDGAAPDDDVPARLLDLMAVLGERYNDATEEQDDLIGRAYERGQAVGAGGRLPGAARRRRRRHRAAGAARRGRRLLPLRAAPAHRREHRRRCGATGTGTSPSSSGRSAAPSRVAWPAYQGEHAAG